MTPDIVSALLLLLTIILLAVSFLMLGVVKVYEWRTNEQVPDQLLSAGFTLSSLAMACLIASTVIGIIT